MTLDLIIIAVIFGALFFSMIQFGKRTAVTTLFSLFSSILVVRYLIIYPVEQRAGDYTFSDSTTLLVFLVVFIISFFVIKNYVKNFKVKGKAEIISSVFLAGTITALILASYFFFLSETLYQFQPAIKNLFLGNDISLGVSITLALVSLFFNFQHD